MNTAILLSGLSHCYNYRHFSKNYIAIDYIFYYNNIKQKLIDFFNKHGKVDVYVSTNDSDKLEDIIKLYNAVNFTTKGNTRNEKIIYGLDLINPDDYDFIVITRFDISFVDDFNISYFDFDKVNIISFLESEDLFCDNFYAFSGKKFKSFYDANMAVIGDTHGHFLNRGNEFFEYNFIKNENLPVDKLSFYRLREYSFLSTTVNRIQNKPGVYNCDRNSTLYIFDTHYSIKKQIAKITDSYWSYYFYEPGVYKIILDIMCGTLKRIKVMGFNRELLYILNYKEADKWKRFEFDCAVDNVLLFNIGDNFGRFVIDFKIRVEKQ